MGIVIPSYEEVESKFENLKDLTPLEKFIMNFGCDKLNKGMVDEEFDKQLKEMIFYVDNHLYEYET